MNLERIPGKSILALVTCRHVLFDGEGTVSLRFHARTAPKDLEAQLGKSIQTGHVRHQKIYYGHPDPEVDLAALNISAIVEENPMIYFRTLGLQHCADFSNPRLGPTSEVIFVGYPIGVHDRLNYLPVLRSGRIATIPQVDFEGRPEFLVDAHVFPGSSGSPVFVALDDQYQFAGVLGQSAIRYAELMPLAESVRQGIEDHIGLGVVYKANAVVELLRTIAEAQHQKAGATP